MASRGLRRDRAFMRVLTISEDKKMILPHAISKELDTVRARSATLHSRLGLWAVKIARNISDGCFYLGEGWSDFAESHPLQEMLFLQFKYVGGMVFKVTIIQIEGEEDMCDSVTENSGEGKEKEFMKVETDSLDLPTNRSMRPQNAACGSRAGQLVVNPIVEVLQHKARGLIRICKKTGTVRQVAIGRDFIRKRKLNERDSVKLISRNGDEFQVRVRTYTHGDGNLIVLLGKGWRDLYDRYNLHEGNFVKIEAGWEAPAAQSSMTFKII